MATLPTRQLGKGGPWVSALGFGAMGLSGESCFLVWGGSFPLFPLLSPFFLALLVFISVVGEGIDSVQ